MPDIFLTPAELKGHRPLPACCVVCGTDNAKLVETAFALQAGRKWSLATGHVSIMRYLTTSLPLCKAHSAYFTSKQWRALIVFGVLVAFFVVMLFTTVLCMLVLGEMGLYVVVPIILLAVVAMFAFIAFMILTSKIGVYPKTIRRDGMLLANVSEEFVHAIEELREAYGESDDSELEEFSEDRTTRRRSIRPDEED